MVAAPIFLAIGRHPKALACAAVFALTSLILRITWHKHLEPQSEPAGASGVPPAPAAGGTAFLECCGFGGERYSLFLNHPGMITL